MAKSLDFDGKMKDKFYAWVEGHLQSNAGKNLSEYPIEHVLYALVTKNGFTLDQIRAELKMRKIIIAEVYFERAQWLLENMEKKNE